MNVYLHEIIAYALFISDGTVGVRGWHPHLLCGQHFKHAYFRVLIEGEANIFEIIRSLEGATIGYFVVVGAQLGGVCALDSIHEVSLAVVFLERVTHGFL